MTGWATLCRLLRAETLKIAELDYVQAAHAFGVSKWRVMARHILPNVMHLVLIVAVLDFSALVLYEAVLSYVGVGVDPNSSSFGSMINLARSEMSRDPVVWWNLATAFTFMLALVLAANLFADAVREAFDPRARVFRPRRLAEGSGVTSTARWRRARGRRPRHRTRHRFRLGARGRRVVAVDRARRNFRAGRRVRLRQIDDRAFDPAVVARQRHESTRAGSTSPAPTSPRCPRRACATCAAAASASSFRSRRRA